MQTQSALQLEVIGIGQDKMGENIYITRMCRLLGKPTVCPCHPSDDQRSSSENAGGKCISFIFFFSILVNQIRSVRCLQSLESAAAIENS